MNQNECLHNIDLDRLISDHREAEGIVQPGSISPRRIRFSAECSKCHALISLDIVITLIMKRIFMLEEAVSRILGVNKIGEAIIQQNEEAQPGVEN